MDNWEDFLTEAETVFFAQCRFNQNLFNQYLVDLRHQVLSPDLRKWLRESLRENRNATWEQVTEMYENNGPGSDYKDPHDSFKVKHLIPDVIN